MSNLDGICPKCGAILILRTAQKGPNPGHRFWGCSNYPTCNYTEEYTQELFTDEEIHIKINTKFPYDHTFSKDEIVSIALENSHSLAQFFYWVIKEKTKYIDHYESFHNYINVGSPYNFTFKNLCESVNSNYNNILTKMYMQNAENVKEDITEWIFEREKRLAIKLKKSRQGEENARKEALIHEENRKKKAEKASYDIFKAIRRGDVKAIIALRKKGASTDKPNEQGLTAIEYANQLGNQDIINALTKDLANEFDNE
jgi:ssDNA-binding Zn-finger/Zn-ribbon topoisomerase 1